MHEHGQHGGHGQAQAQGEHIDPVCGMTVKESPTAIKSDYKGQTYYFCSRGCKVAFDKNPDTYLQGGPQVHM